MEADQTKQSRSRLFAVRVWTEDGAGGREFRGSARDVVTGAYRGFREWSELTEFLVARMDEVECAEAERTEGGNEWLSRQMS